MSISDNMKKIRLQKGLTQKQVADACGMVDATYRTYELGKANPKPATVSRIAKALGVPVSEVYGVDWAEALGDSSPEISSAVYQSILTGQGGALPIDAPIQNRLLMAYSKLNEQGQLEIIKRVEEMGQIPVYQSSPNISVEFTQEEFQTIKGAMYSLENARLEIRLMTERDSPVPPTSRAMISAKTIEERSIKELSETLYTALKRKVDSQKTE